MSLPFHVIVLWDGNIVLDGNMSAVMALDTAKGMRDNFVIRKHEKSHVDGEIDGIRKMVFGAMIPRGTEVIALWGDETGSCTIKVTKN